MQELCLVGAELRKKGLREPCVSGRKSDVGLWTEMSPSTQNWKERLTAGMRQFSMK